MPLAVGHTLPRATPLTLDANGHPQPVDLHALLHHKRVVLFALPGAFTATCHTQHMPSFVRTADAFRAKGIDHIACLAVNDPFVLSAWFAATGALAAGITPLADAGGSFTQSVGMEFTRAEAGLYNRSERYALYADNAVVQILHREANPGVCNTSAGEALLAAI